MQGKGILAGVTVLDLTRLLPGPYCSMILADHGARVIAVEDAKYKADGFFAYPLYRNKEHICLDLKSESGLQVFMQLVQKAQVVLEGFRPGVKRRLGVDYESLRQVNAQIIYCSISGYGQFGPYRDRAGHDVNYLAASGVLDLQGEPDRPPSIPGVQIADLTAGLNAALGVVLALYEKQRTGQGQYIDVSMADSCLALMPLVQYLQEKTGQKLQRGQHLLAHRYACYNTYQTLDGRYLALGALESKFWHRLCRHLGLEEYSTLQYDDSRRQEIIQALRGVFKQKDLAHWQQELSELDVCFAPVKSLQEAWQDPQFQKRGMVRDWDLEQGQGKALGIPIIFSHTPGGLRWPAPDFGQDTLAVLRELGYSQQEINSLFDQGLV